MLPNEPKGAAHRLQAAPCRVSGGWNKAWVLLLGRIIPALRMLRTNTGHQEHKNRLTKNPQDLFLSKRGRVSQRVWRLSYISSALALLPLLSPARAEALPLIPFHSSIRWADARNATSAENSCSHQGRLQPSLLQHSSHCHSIRVPSWAACKQPWIRRAPVLVLNPLEQVVASASPAQLLLFWKNSALGRALTFLDRGKGKIDPPRKSLEWINLRVTHLRHRAQLCCSALLKPLLPTIAQPAAQGKVLAESTKGQRFSLARFLRLFPPAHRSTRIYKLQICPEAAKLADQLRVVAV